MEITCPSGLRGTIRGMTGKEAQAFVDHGHRIVGRSHLRGADRVEDRGADVSGGLGERGVVVADRGAGQEFLGMILLQRLLLHQSARGADRVGRDLSKLAPQG